MKAKICVMAMLFVCFGICACGSSTSSGGSDVPTISDVSQLPKATSPMAASASTSISAAKGFLKANAATTGQLITQTPAPTFNYASSMGACNTFNVLKQGVSSASQADMILCFISQMNSAFGAVTDSNGNVINIYDGNYHIFNLSIAGDTGAPDRVKMKIVKTGGSITDFKMWMCKKSGDIHYQSEYTDQVINGASVSMTALGLYSEGQNSGRHYVNVSGTMDADRVYTTKTITTKNWNTDATDPTNWSETILTQTPGAFSFSGYNKGSYTDNSGSGSYEDKTVGLGQMIGDTGSIAMLAMGDGAVRYEQRGTSGGNTYGQGGVNAWNGDTTAPEAAASNDYYTTADGSTYSTPAVQSSAPTIAFSSDQTWDCSDDVSVGIYSLPETQFTTIATKCADYNFSNSWINCYSEIGMCNGDNVCASMTGSSLTSCRACFTDGMARKAGTATENCLNAAFPGEPWVSQVCPAM